MEQSDWREQKPATAAVRIPKITLAPDVANVMVPASTSVRTDVRFSERWKKDSSITVIGLYQRPLPLVLTNSAFILKLDQVGENTFGCRIPKVF